MNARSSRATTQQPPLLTVASLAKGSGLDAEVVRYYTRIGLLRPVMVSSNGYRRFEGRDVKRLLFVKAAQRLGFTLVEIREVLFRSRRGQSPCPMVRDVLRRRVEERAKAFDIMGEQLAHMRRSLGVWDRMTDRAPTGEEICVLVEAVAELEPRTRLKDCSGGRPDDRRN